MSRVDRALSKDPFQVDETQCLRAAQAISNFSPEDSINPWSSAPIEAQVIFKIFFVAICHQINWDFLQSRLYHHFFSSDYREMLLRALTADSKMIRAILSGYHKPERIRASERARYLRNTALALATHFPDSPIDLLGSGRIFGEGGLLDNMKLIPAYSEDPLTKKSNAFAQELAREGIFIFPDSDEIPPAIDYHLIRLYLRTGRVITKSQDIFESLRSGETHRPRLVRLLREKISAALSLTAAYAHMPAHHVNYLEWQIGRSRCEKELTNCDGSWPADLFDVSITSLSHGCPLAGSCVAYGDPVWKSLLEPALKTAFY